MHRSTVISLPILLDLHATPLFMRTRDDSTVGPPCQHNEEKIMLAGPTVESQSLFHEEVFQGLVSEHNSREDITTLDLSLENTTLGIKPPVKPSIAAVLDPEMCSKERWTSYADNHQAPRPNVETYSGI